MNTSRSSSLTAKSSGISHSSSPKEVRKEKKINTGETKYRYGWIHRLIFRNQVYRVNGPQSEAFNRRTYEIPIEELKQIKNDNIGFTNHTLCKIEKNKVQLYVPVYLSLKIKSIQEISLSELLARIGCVLIVFINIQNLPQKLITHLSSHIMVQINRGVSFLLAQTIQTGKIILKRDKKFLTFTIRDTFPVQIYEDVFLSPFEILNLVFTVTFNSTTIKLEEENLNAPPLLLRRTSNSANIETVSADNKTVKTVQHIVSFNCMRHPLKIPITYAQECKLGVYDLAEQLLDYYSTDKASYPEVIDCFEDFLQEKEKEEKSQKCSKAKNDKKGKEPQKSLKEKGKKDKKAEKDETAMIQNQVIYNFKVPQSRQPLVMKPVNKQDKKEKQASYFQYTHFVIPLYKFPGNAWATIFIPMFMLALLSIFIFLQTSTSVEEKLGSIATFVLGFIALVPNIKSELPPSQKISFSEIIVYVESINCMLSLLQQFPGASSLKKKPNIWKNPLFLVSITIHIICFASSLILLCLHYFVWQPRYNIKKGQPLSSPKTDYDSWNNPYCDEKFLKFNSDMRKNPSDITNQIFEWPLSNYDKLVQAQDKAEDKVKQTEETSLLKIEEKKVR